MPAGDHLAAQERAASERVFDLLTRGRVGEVGLRSEVGCSGELLGCGALDRSRAAGQAAQRAGQRPPNQVGPRLGVGRQPVEPPSDRRKLPARETSTVELGLAHDEEHGVEALCSHHLLEVRGHLPLGVVGDTVEHERERRAALSRRQKELPWHGIGVPGGRRHEEPRVGGREQLIRERPVLREHGVDVGGIEQGESSRDLGNRGEEQCPRRR